MCSRTAQASPPGRTNGGSLARCDRGRARRLGRVDLGKSAVGFGHLAHQPFAESSGGSRFLRALGANDVIAVRLANIDAERPQEPAVDNRIGAQNLVTESEALARLGGL